MEPEIITFTGRVVTPFDPTTAQIDIQDIAHALSQQCRFTGHTSKFYSVAEHSVLVAHLAVNLASRIARSTEEDLITVAMYGLLHDASKAYMAGIASPVKSQFPEYKRAEKKLEAVIFRAFGLSSLPPILIKRADQMLLSAEAAELLPSIFMKRYAAHLSIPPDNIPLTIGALPPANAKRLFMDTFSRIKERFPS